MSSRWMSLVGLNLGLGLAVAASAGAEVVDSQPGGFTTRQSVVIDAPIATVWADLVRPAAWWSSDHTFSHDAANLALEPRVGGEWRETLPDGGGVRHMVVVNVAPPTTLRLEGGLGPLQALGVAGHLTFALKAQGATTQVTQTYDVGGHAPGGLTQMAGPVDHVLGEQLSRLKALAETGKAP
jgi:uncharacterized protein YndB with AHSA1/START domain